MKNDNSENILLEAMKAIERFEWCKTNEIYDECCPVCYEPKQVGHKDNCKLFLELTKLTKNLESLKKESIPRNENLDIYSSKDDFPKILHVIFDNWEHYSNYKSLLDKYNFKWVGDVSYALGLFIVVNLGFSLIIERSEDDFIEAKIFKSLGNTRSLGINLKNINEAAVMSKEKGYRKYIVVKKEKR